MNEGVSPRLVDNSRACIETMQSWVEGEPVWPYARIIETWGREFMPFIKRWRDVGAPASFRRESRLYEVRIEYVARFGFAIPCAELLDALAEAAPIIEVGAGSGYMTRLMRVRGIDVIGSDLDQHKNNSGHGFIVAEHDPLQWGCVAAKAMVRHYSDRTAFCSWPTLNATWFRQMLRAMRIGQRLIVIRAECCAERSAWDYIDDCFEETGGIELPNFPFIRDFAGIYIKRRQDGQTESRTSLLGRARSVPGRAAAANRKRASKAA